VFLFIYSFIYNNDCAFVLHLMTGLEAFANMSGRIVTCRLPSIKASSSSPSRSDTTPVLTMASTAPSPRISRLNAGLNTARGLRSVGVGKLAGCHSMVTLAGTAP